MLRRALINILLSSVSGYFVLNCNLLVTERIDPLLNPDALSNHVHSVAGANTFGKTYSYETNRLSQCTTCNTLADLSSYWAPTLYYQSPEGKLSPYPLGNVRVYYLYPPGGDGIEPFPMGFAMIAGDTARRTFDPSNVQDNAVMYVCLDSSGAASGTSNEFPKKHCPGGIQAQIRFPSCWNGRSVTSPDYKSHVAYLLDEYGSGSCPDGFPHRLPQLMYEFIWLTGVHPYHGDGTYVLSNGDTTGNGLHGDFASGWDLNVLDSAIKQCGFDESWGEVYGCAPLREHINLKSQTSCKIETEVVVEDIGLDGPIDELPGNNPVGGAMSMSMSSSTVTMESSVEIGDSGRVLQKPNSKYTKRKLATNRSTIQTSNNWYMIGCAIRELAGPMLFAKTSMYSEIMDISSCLSFCWGFEYAALSPKESCFCGSGFETNNFFFVPELLCNKEETYASSALLSVYKSSIET